MSPGLPRRFREHAPPIGGSPSSPVFLGCFFAGVNAAFQKSDGLLGHPGARDLESLAALLVVGNEEFLNLVEQGLAYLID